MSSKILPNIAARIRETAVSVAWAQWAALGSMASTVNRATSIVDPEALVLLSLAFREHERRLWDLLRAWVPVGVRLLSVQRTRNLARSFPESTTQALHEFAALAVVEGKDARWKSLAGDVDHEVPRGRGKEWEVTGEFVEPSALMMRLRLGFGVGLRADALSYLLAERGKWIAVRPLAKALGFTDAATRRALDDLAAARFIHATVDDQPTTYFADTKAWSKVLEISQPPKWHGWFETFALFADLDDWWRSTQGRKVTEYAADTLLRQKLKEHQAAFAQLAVNGIGVPSRRLDGSDLERLINWIDKNV